MAAKKAAQKATQLHAAPPPADQTLEDRIAKLEERLDKYSQVLGGLLAQQITPALQEQIAKGVQEQLS